jgi:ABC-type multidrug transport system fused ATPase/permease subunit
MSNPKDKNPSGMPPSAPGKAMPPGAPMRAGAMPPGGAMPGGPMKAGPGGMPAGMPGGRPGAMPAGPGGMPGRMPGGPAGPGGPGGPPGGMPGGMPGRGARMMMAPSSKISYRRMYKWGWHMIMFTPVLFIISRLFVLIQSALGPINAAIFSNTLVILQGGQVKGWVAMVLRNDKWIAAIVFLAVGLGSILVAFVSKVLTTWNDNTMNKALRQELHDKLMTLGPTYHNSHDLGENMTVVMQFSTGANMILSEIYATPVIRVIIIVVTTMLMAEQFSALKAFPCGLQILLLIALAAIPIIGYWLSSRLKEAYTQVRDSQIAMSNEFTNSLNLPLEVQLMGAQNQRAQAFAARVGKYFSDQFKAAIKNDMAGQFRISSTLFLQIIFVFSAAYYSMKPGAGDATQLVGVILSSYLLIPFVVGPIQEIIEFINGVNRSWPQVEKVIDLLEAGPDVTEKPGAAELTPASPAVQLQNVSFAYVEGGTKILKDITYTFAPGNVTAVVSIAGGGKSTISNLIARLRDPQQGKVLIDTQDLRDVSFKSLRRTVVKVSQFPLFVSASIRDNMKLAAPDATDAQLEAACRRTGIWEILVSACPPGTAPLDYHLPASVSEGLSGGQRKLLAFTRALLLEPAILITDEMTTGMDNLLKQLLVKIVRETLTGVTVILVEHDMPFIEQVADQICCLESGKFTDVGSPKELLGRPTLYKKLYEAYEQEEKKLP